MKLAAFDFDATLMDGETIDILAQEMGLEKEVSVITESAMNGKLDFYKSLVSRVRLLEGLEVNKVNEVCHSLPLMKGAKHTIAELKNRGFKIVCFSGGFRNATSYYRSVLGIHADFSNILHSEKDVLTGEVGGDMMFDFSKGDMLLRLQSLLGIDRQNTMVVGDGANDLSMFEHADTRIAFCAKDTLKKAANIIIEEKDLTKILDEIGD